MGERVLDAGADRGFDRVGLRCLLWHWLASRLLAMDAAGPALPLEPLLVGLAVISGISRGLGGGPVTRDDIPEPLRAPVEAECTGGLAFADEAEGPADRDAVPVAEAGDCNIDVGLAVGHGPGFG